MCGILEEDLQTLGHWSFHKLDGWEALEHETWLSKPLWERMKTASDHPAVQQQHSAKKWTPLISRKG